jgi:hypothetical protein
MLLVYRLLAHVERVRDVLPGPALPPGVVDLEPLERFEQPAQGDHGAQAGPGIGAARRGGQIRRLTHAVNLR